MSKTLQVLDLGLIDYQDCWQKQKELQKDRIAGNIGDSLILCQHQPVITLGKSSKPENILKSQTELDKLGISTISIERGGDVTYHNPGQLVGYPIFDLKDHRRDVDWYMRKIEQLIIKSLAEVQLQTCQRTGDTGVWLPLQEPQEIPRKIASIGVRISRWCTMHGFALNVENSLDGFNLINPCGFKNIEITSVQKEFFNCDKSSLPDLEDIKSIVLRNLIVEFGFNRFVIT